MADVIDQANELADMHLKAALEAHKGGTHLHYCGRCWNCSEHISEGSFCDRSCGEDWEKRRAFSRNSV